MIDGKGLNHVSEYGYIFRRAVKGSSFTTIKSGNFNIKFP